MNASSTRRRYQHHNYASSSSSSDDSSAAPTPQLPQRRRDVPFMSPNSLLNFFHPKNKTNEPLNVARKQGNERRRNHEKSGKVNANGKQSSRQPAPMNKKRKAASKEHVSVKKHAPQPKHYQDDDDDDDDDSDDSVGSEDSFSSQSEQELQLKGSKKQKTIHSISSHSIRQKSDSRKFPVMGRQGNQSEDDKESSPSSSSGDDDDESTDQVGRGRFKQQQQQQSRKTNVKEIARALSRNAIRRKNARQTFARRPESSSEEEEESSQSEDARGQRRPGKMSNKKTSHSLLRNVVRRKTSKSQVARAQENSDDSEWSNSENKTTRQKHLVNGRKVISKRARSLPTQAARRHNQQRKQHRRDSLAGGNSDNNGDESSLEDLPNERLFEQNGTGTKPVHANTIHFSVQAMRKLVHPVTKQQVQRLKRQNAKSEANALLISSEKHAQRIVERVRKRLRSTNLPNTYFRCEDSCVENVALVNQQQQEENTRAKALSQKLLEQKMQLEKQLEREEQKLHRTQGMAAAAEEAIEGIHPLISSFLDDGVRNDDQIGKGVGKQPSSGGRYRPAPKGTMARLLQKLTEGDN